MDDITKKEVLNTVVKALRKCYPDTFQITKYGFGDYNIDIHFPVINIRNKHNEKHVIHDIIVRIPFDFNPVLDKYLIKTLRGTRISFSKAEALSGYEHSHLSYCLNNSWGNWNTLLNNCTSKSQEEFEDCLKDDIYSFSQFCLGYGGINNIILQLNQNTKNQLDINNWILFFKSIKNYLEYESIEGGPYRRINSITSDIINDSYVGLSTIQSNLNYNWKAMTNLITMLVRTKQLELYLNSNFKITYIYNANLEEIFYTCGMMKLLPSTCVYFRQGNKYASLNSGRQGEGYFTKENIDKLETYGFPFRDYKIPCKLIDKDKQINKEDKLIKVVHPLIVKRILNYYVTELNRTKSKIINSRNEITATASDF